MSSPTGPRNTVPRGSFLLLQDEAPLAPKGHGALASLIRHHPTAALANPFGREGGEEGAGEGSEDESARREERRMSAILNSSHVRSMRLIGNSNPRYRWERYWRSEAELAAMPKHMSVQ